MSVAPVAAHAPAQPGPGPIPERLLRALDDHRRAAHGRAARRRLPLALLGQGSELAQIRPYTPGDDVRQIDWNVTARTGEPHVRVQHAERVLVTWLVLDTSPSMSFGTAERRKADVAEGVAIAIGHVATRRGNRLGVVTFGDAQPRSAPVRQGRHGLIGLLGDAARGQSRTRRGRVGATSLGEAIRRADALARQRSFVVLVSDFRGPDDWRRPLLQLAGRHDVVAVEIRDPREQELPNAGELWLVDPETGRQLRVDTRSAKLRRRFAEAAAAERRARRADARVDRRSPRRADDVRRLAPRAGAVPAKGRSELRLADLAARRSCSLPLLRRRLPACASERASVAPPSGRTPALLPNLVERAPGRPTPPAGRAAARRARGDDRRRRAAARDGDRPPRGGDRPARDGRLALDGRDRRAADAPAGGADGGDTSSSTRCRRSSASASSRSRRARRSPLPPTDDRALVQRRDRIAAHRRRHGDRRRRAARRDVSASGSAPTASSRRPPSCSSPTARATAAAARRSPPHAQAKALHVPVYTILLGTPSGIVQHKLPGGYTETIRVPPSAQTLQMIARTSGGEFFTASNDKRLGEVYDQLRSRLGHKKQSREITDVFAGGSALLLLVGGALSASLVPEGAVRRALVARRARGSSALAASVEPRRRDERVPRLPRLRARRGPVGGRARVASDCRGPQVQYQLTCPRGYIVGGLDAELTDRAIDVWFLGASGSPVAPGRTTSRTVVFVATYVGIGARAPTFRPHAGCIPARRRRTADADVVSRGRSARAGRRCGASGRSGSRRRAPSPCAAGATSASSPRTARAASARRSRRRLTWSRASRRSPRSRSDHITVSRTRRRQAARVVQVAAVCAGGR